MKPVMQTICNFQTGNCVQACVASIFELPLDQVPNFMMGGPDHFRAHLNWWCYKIGIVALDICFGDADAEALIFDSWVIAVGKTPRLEEWDGLDPEYREKYKDARHAVVWHNGKIAHDPYPNGKGLIGKPELFTVFIIKDPSKLLKFKKK